MFDILTSKRSTLITSNLTEGDDIYSVPFVWEASQILTDSKNTRKNKEKI